jgi:hypothetical protein
MSDVPYNPLDKFSLAKSIESEILVRSACLLKKIDDIDIKGAGVYVIYYVGDFASYAPVRNRKATLTKPIYIGKAIPKGGRKGGLSKDASATGRALLTRLRQHATSIDECKNLILDDFYVRYLLVDDVWIPLGENVLIETFKPVWNWAIDGFGNKVPGKRRKNQFKSPWDVLHPGRKLAEGLGDSGMTPQFLRERVADYFAGKPLAKLPKAIADQQAEQESEAAEIADEI